jgi:trk system potassium uptake protein TrkA
MRVVIIGAGHDGFYLAETLAAEGQDVVVIEVDEAKAARVRDRLDTMVIVGNGASPAVLRRAGADRADLVLAVSDRDGANVLACHSAKSLGAGRTVARVEDLDIREVSPGLGVDVVIDAREAVAREVTALVEHAGVADYVEFAGGRLVLVGGRVRSGSPAADRTLRDLRAATGWPWVLAAVVRGGETLMGRGGLIVRPDDHAVVMTEAGRSRRVAALLGVDRGPVHRAILLGGTRIAEMSAASLVARGIETVIVDAEPERCEAISRRSKALVIQGDPTEPEVLADLQPGPADVVVGLSAWDEVNLMGCMVARASGATTTIARFGRRALAGLLKDVGVDAVVSSRVAAADAILRFVRRGRILSVATFIDSDAEAMEIEVAPESRSAGLTLAGIDLPAGSVVGGIIRGEEAFVPDGSTQVRGRDRLVLLTRREAIDAIEALFAAS